MSSDFYDILVVGGGFYGSTIAEKLATNGANVALIESEPELMRRASYNNQARVHAGYHYPRNFMTARRAQVLMPRFVHDYKDAIDANVPSIYAIAKKRSKVTAATFKQTMAAIGASLTPAPKTVSRLFSKTAIEEVFLAEEPIFNASKLREIMTSRLNRCGVKLKLSQDVSTFEVSTTGFHLTMLSGQSVHSRQVYICAYSGINRILGNCGLPLIPLTHQWAELALVHLPDSLNKYGLTVMDGPFFSALPFPDRKCHSLTHVSYTPHCSWEDQNGPPPQKPKQSAFNRIIKDAALLLPDMESTKHIESLWEVKTILPKNEGNDGRPILFLKNYQHTGLHIVLGSKLDAALEVTDAIGGSDEMRNAI